jgi:hypothetical protein
VSNDLCIVLGTYNGAPYLQAQIESILRQTVRGWTLLVRDDGSSDSTPDLLRQIGQSDQRIEILSADHRHLGPVGNFSCLAQAALERGARYVMFADQDDLWFPEKVGHTLACLHTAEQQHGSARPLLVHTDLEVIDREGGRIHPSFMRFQGLRHEDRDPLRTLLVQNFVTGCTVVVNRALLSIALPFPGEAPMHDWWCALCAAACGRCEFLPRVTMGYRRHEANTVTARGYWRTMDPRVTSWREVYRTGLTNHAGAVSQAMALQERLEARGEVGGSPPMLATIRSYVDLHRSGRSAVDRLRRAIAMNLRSQTLARTAALYLRLATWPQA